MTAAWGGQNEQAPMVTKSFTHKPLINVIKKKAARLGGDHPRYADLRAAAALLDIHDNASAVLNLKYHPDLRKFVEKVAREVHNK